MTPAEMQEAGAGSNLASWTPLLVLLAGYALIVIALSVLGRPRRPASGALDTWVARTSGGLTTVTGLPGWACAAAGTSLYGLLIAGVGFYSDVAWHIALGRDEDLFTAPHTAIVVGLAMLVLGAVLGILVATFDREPVGRRVGALTVPWSCLPLGALGIAALAGFPLDELWHLEYGIDVTMWSPTHLQMILGASLSGMASWLIFAEAGIRPGASAWGRAVHVLAAWLTLQGLAAAQGEFSFGVPQFQQLYHPVLVLIAGAGALVATRIVLGPGWALGITTVNALLMGVSLTGSDSGPVPTREGGLYIASALVVEAAAWLLGTGRDARERLRFALVAGAGVATFGLAGEFAWNAGARQPWTTALLPDAVLVGGLAALGAAVLGACLGRAVALETGSLRLPRWAVVAGGAAVLVALALPLPRDVGDVTAHLELLPAGVEDEVVPRVTLDPPDAAEGARWFQAMSWQGGELRIVEMVALGDGVYQADGPVPVFGKGKALVRLHRGSEMMAIPIRLPADPEIGATEIPAVDRTVPFTSEQRFLLREQTPGGAVLALVIYALLTGVGVVWAWSFAVAARRIAGGGAADPSEPRPLAPTSSG
jgi:hypothetical protein